MRADEMGMHGMGHSVRLTLPPLGVILLRQD
jgi:hypothetical protein